MLEQEFLRIWKSYPVDFRGEIVDAVLKYYHKGASRKMLAQALRDTFSIPTHTFSEWVVDNIRNEDRRKSLRRDGKNPKKEVRRKNSVRIYDTILEIRAKKGNDSLWPKELFKHKFSERTKAEILGNADGSLTVRSQVGKRLWKKFNYDKRDI
jgi:hypothetical protein